MKKRKSTKKDKSKAEIYIEKLISQISIKRFRSEPKYRLEVLNIIKEYKYNNSINDTKNLYEKLPFIYKQLIKSDLFPNEIKTLNSSKLGSDFGNTSDSLHNMVILFSMYSKEINFFLTQKKLFESSILLNDYDFSKNKLLNIEKNIGYTNWSIYNTFLLKEYTEGFEGNFNFLKYIIDKGANHPLNSILSFSFSRMVENELIISNYKNTLDIEIYKPYKISDKMKIFLESYINPFNLYFTINIDGIFKGENATTLIDQYILFKKVLIYLFINDPKLCLEIIKNVLTYINDPQLKMIYFFLTNDLEILDSIKLDKKVYEILDLYIAAKYNECKLLSKEYLYNNEFSIEIAELYIKSHINLGLVITQNEDSLLNNILINMYDILTKNSSMDKSLSYLSSLAFSIHHFDISFQIQYFINKIKNTEESIFYKKTYQIFSPIITPKILLNIKEINAKRKFLETIYRKLDSTTTEFFIELLNFEEFDSMDIKKLSISDDRLKIYTAKILFDKEKYVDVIKILEPLLYSFINIPYTYEECLQILYTSYSKEKEYQKCIDLYIKNYFINKNLLNNIDVGNEVKFIDNLGYKNLINNIDLILFISICNVNQNILFLMYRKFMESINYTHPSLINSSLLQKDKFIYFLHKVCTQNVLAKDVENIKNTDQAENERLKIAKLLIVINDSNDNKIYKDEIAEIAKNINIKERMIAVDKSKIYIDIAGLKNDDLKNFEKSFIRFKKVQDLTEKNFNENYKTNENKNRLEDEENNYTKKLVSQGQQLKTIFYELFTEIRDKYLFSNDNGLDGYLSTRIRHGIITGQLRNPFTTLKLITKRDSDTKVYKDNIFWIKKLNITDDNEIKKFNEIMNSFSKRLNDDFIFIKDYLIQISTDINKDGLFNFSLIKYETALLNSFSKNFIECPNSEEFIEHSITMCNFMTDLSLMEIGSYFDKIVKKNINILIDDLEKNIHVLNKNNNIYSPLQNNIRNAKAGVNSSIEIIKTWFDRKEIKSTDFKIEDVLITSQKIIKNLFPNIYININITNDAKDLLFYGKYFIDFVDCFKIFLENILEYSQNHNQIIVDMNININQDSNFIYCNIANCLVDNSKMELNRLSKEIIEIESRINGAITNTNRNKEGKSGFIKATKIIKLSFLDRSNTLNMRLKDDKIIVEFKLNKKRISK